MSGMAAAGATDPGRIRSANEDAYFVGETVFAVADGMGGHLAGEVASAAALEPVRSLDGRVFADGDEALDGLRAAVRAANQRVSELAEVEPTYRGMGTTLTAAMVEGRRVHVAHVGDSRAYLLRDGAFSQVTNDHTLVQHLVDEGQITPAEAAVHPQRSIITRAIGVSEDVEVDGLTLDVREGDQLLLCSDGLSGPVTDDAIARELERHGPLEASAQRLVDLANERGGPDNITVVLLRFGAPDAVVDAADGAYRPAPSPPPPSPPRAGVRPRRRHPLLWTAVAVLVLAGALAGGRVLLGRSYYVGLEAGEVAIFQGVPVEIGPVSLSWTVERTDLRALDLPGYLVTAFDEGRAAADLADARRIVAAARFTAADTSADGPGTGSTDTTTPSDTTTLSPGATP